MQSIGLYIHIPFCISKCGYCDFYSGKHSEGAMDEYIAALCAHMREYGALSEKIVADTVFIGGGTPTAIGIKRLVPLIKEIKRCFRLTKTCEFTVEVNPATADKAAFKALRKAGVNRISIGVQSAHDFELTTLGRKHTFKQAEDCILAAREAKLENISLDIMYGIPHQTVQSFDETLNRVIRLAPSHISMYGLKIEPGTPFHREAHTLSLPDEESERSMYFLGIMRLEQAGYMQYEISNFALKGRACRHNLKYWNCEDYIGLGPSAHSYFGGIRYSYHRDIKKYVNSILRPQPNMSSEDIFGKNDIYDDYIPVRPNECIGEYVMLRLRLREGVSLSAFTRRFGQDFEVLYLDKLSPFIASGHARRTKTGYALTPDGMYVSNYILSRVVDFE